MSNRNLCFVTSICLFLASYIQLIAGFGVQEQLWLEVLHPSDVAFAYKIRPAKDFGDIVEKPFRRIRLVSTEPAEACSHVANGNELKGQVALIKRGDCSFVSKSLNAELYGAVAVVITDSNPNENLNWVDMIGDGTNRENKIGIPAFFMLGKDGHMIFDSMRRHRRSALVNIPVNFTRQAEIKQPPWDFW